jgi:beta-barrel assembly-enhancing protease
MIRRVPVRRGRSSGMGGRLMIAIILAVIAVAGYYLGTREEYNPITEENQRIGLTVEEEIALGLQSAPQMAQEFGGLYPDEQVQARIDEIGRRLVESSQARETEYPFEFHVLADDQTVNAFALPGGQVFITVALLNLLETEGEVAGVLGHEIGHVVGRHSAEQIAKSQLIQGLAGAAGAGLYDPENPQSATGAQIALIVGNMINMKYGRDDELQSDRLGVRFLADAGYDPRALIRVMEVLAGAGGGGGAPEFMSTHPDPGNRIEEIERAIEAEFPNGVPEGLEAMLPKRLLLRVAI